MDEAGLMDEAERQIARAQIPLLIEVKCSNCLAKIADFTIPLPASIHAGVHAAFPKRLDLTVIESQPDEEHRAGGVNFKQGNVNKIQSVTCGCIQESVSRILREVGAPENWLGDIDFDQTKEIG